MARSHPVEPRWAPDTAPAERALWRWAVAQLPAEVVVLPQVAMATGRGGRLQEAEADLVLLDPGHGVTVVEVKGGTVAYDAERAVWRRREAGSAVIRDPVDQVKRTRTVLRQVLQAAGIDTAAVALRWVVAVPECRLEAPGEPVLPDDRLWDVLAADRLEERYRTTCGPLVAGEQPLGTGTVERLAGLLRGRSRTGRVSLAVSVGEHEERVRVRTEAHRNILHHFAANPHVLVHGSAGTGKTVLALEAAITYASLGQRVLLACWNVVLSHWLRERLRSELAELGSPAADRVTDRPTGRVVVHHLAGLAGDAAADGPGPTVARLAGEDAARYFHEDLPGQLTPALTGGEFDVVILDEAQDLTELWVLAVAGLVARQGRWYAFADGHQDLFGADAALPEFLELQHELTENLRNTRQIARFAAGFGAVEQDCTTGDGPAVRFIPTASERVVARATEVARRLQRDERLTDDQIATLWLFHNPRQGASDQIATAALQGGPVATNGATFKGMERPAVVLGLDLDPARTERTEQVRRAIYTAATRARSLLVVVGDPDAAASLGLDGLATQLRAGAEPA